MQHPNSPRLVTGVETGCSELSPTYCSPPRMWAEAGDSAPAGHGHASGVPQPGTGAQPSSATRPRNAEGAMGGSVEGPGGASYGMAG